ncbi:hypothetical protein NI17_003700 [Thermobifida halotolerans]|uniref:Uncharacterized protein n=1 Tax=Thermobifida halotolerans TaxID=483545 RepID=A0AA97M4I7_9ACTN|nr:hypothetical protein [Thermobifida halotolerans]UOE20354.1 hypothetical protein NI17_003700 [Thermobifida halotolerans]
MADLPALSEQAGAEPELAVLDALLPAFDALGRSRSDLYSGYVFAALPATARKHLEDAMNAGIHGFRSDFVGRPHRQGRAEGLAGGEAEAVLTVPDARGIGVSGAVRERVTSCTDLDQFAVRIRRAATARTAEELFHRTTVSEARAAPRASSPPGVVEPRPEGVV